MEYKKRLGRSCNPCSIPLIKVIEKEVIKEVPVGVPVEVSVIDGVKVIKYLNKKCVMPKPVKIIGCDDFIQILYDDDTFHEVSKDIMCGVCATQETKLKAYEEIIKQLLDGKEELKELKDKLNNTVTISGLNGNPVTTVVGV